MQKTNRPDSSRKCHTCGKVFCVSVRLKNVRAKAKFCSESCFDARYKVIIKESRYCSQCGVEFIKAGDRPPANHTKRKFCSKSCGVTYIWASRRKTFAEKFWARVRIGKEDECWLWDGPVRSEKSQYGQVAFKKKRASAHRVAFELTYGDISEGMYILHSCDTPPCCNPRHLREGTHLENMSDMIARNRRPGLHRDINPASKVTAHQKTQIITEYDALPRLNVRQVKSGELKKLAEKYNVSAALVNDLVRHRNKGRKTL